MMAEAPPIATLLAGAMAEVRQDPTLVLAVVGPTATGKTALAIELAQALGAEIINVDSVQLYRLFDIGSGKPTRDELGQAVHHFVGERDARTPMDAAEFAQAAVERIGEIHARGKPVIVAGGTFLWVKSVLYGLADAPKADAEIRARHAVIAQNEGRAALHSRLSEVDVASAARLHPNDFVRVSRALEVFELTGKPMSAIQEAHGFASPRFKSKLLAYRYSPEALTERIASRVHRWLDGGWVDEVRQLVVEGYGDTRPMGSVGYREVKAMLDGALPESELADAIVRATRVFARRQRTWLAHEQVTWLETGK